MRLSTGAILRDTRAVGGKPLPRGDRRALDAEIATHAVVADVTEGLLWVAEPPHLRGAFRRIDVLAELGLRPQARLAREAAVIP